MRLPLLFLHISGGILGLLSGTVAMIYRKRIARAQIGGRRICSGDADHGRVRGDSGANEASGRQYLRRPDYVLHDHDGVARRAPREGVSALDWAALAMAVALGAGMITLGVGVVRGIYPQQEGVPIAMDFIMGSIPLLAAAGDLRMLVLGGISGTARLSRHLWRMCFGLFIASGSFFLGQQQVFPASSRGSPVWFVPALLPLALLIFWMIRVRVGKRYKNVSPTAKGAEAYAVRV